MFNSLSSMLPGSRGTPSNGASNSEAQGTLASWASLSTYLSQVPPLLTDACCNQPPGLAWNSPQYEAAHNPLHSGEMKQLWAGGRQRSCEAASAAEQCRLLSMLSCFAELCQCAHARKDTKIRTVTAHAP